MKNLLSIICLTIAMLNLVACSSAPAKYGNSPEQQRKNAKESQDELSKDINGGER